MPHDLLPNSLAKLGSVLILGCAASCRHEQVLHNSKKITRGRLATPHGMPRRYIGTVSNFQPRGWTDVQGILNPFTSFLKNLVASTPPASSRIIQRRPLRHIVSAVSDALEPPRTQPPLTNATVLESWHSKLLQFRDSLGDEMKGYEAETCNAVADISKPIVVRLDGNSFGKYTKGFTRPFDVRIHNAMLATTIDLLEYFGEAVTAYTESDEISVIFPPRSSRQWNGRVQKLCSLSAGFASARFNLHMVAQHFEDTAAEHALRKRVHQSQAHFDSRVFALPSEERLVAYTKWRALKDCRRNSITMLAQCYFSEKQLHGVHSNDKLQMLVTKGVQWEDTPPFYRYGTFVKKEHYSKSAFNPKLQQHVAVKRKRITARSFQFDPEDANFLLAPFWDEHEKVVQDASDNRI